MKLARALSNKQGRTSTLNTVIVPAEHKNKLIRVTPLQSATSLSYKRPAVNLVVAPAQKKVRR